MINKYTNNFMMKHFKIHIFLKLIILTFFFSVICVSCSDEDTAVDCIPYVSVHAQYNLSLPFYSDLNMPNGYVELPPDGTNGSRGVIIVNTGNGFNAYDRNAPQICPSPNSTLVVEDDIKIVCPQDGAEWVLRSGQPLNDATQGRTPRRFYTQLDGYVLTITY